MKINLNTIPTISLEGTGKRIQQLRKEKKYSQVDIASAMSVSSQAVHKWEKGKCLPTIDNAVILTRIFGISLDELYVLNEPSPDGGDNLEPVVNRFEFASQRMAG